MGTFILNIIHRPEMVPEYAEKVTGQGKAEDIGRTSVLTESLDIFKMQQAIAHENGFRTTIQRFPDDDLTVIILANRTDVNPQQFALKVADLFLEAKHP